MRVKICCNSSPTTCTRTNRAQKQIFFPELKFKSFSEEVPLLNGKIFLSANSLPTTLFLIKALKKFNLKESSRKKSGDLTQLQQKQRLTPFALILETPLEILTPVVLNLYSVPDPQQSIQNPKKLRKQPT